ncbi:hypothetical protein PGB90_008598 [Kerria lacca]
MNSDSNQVPITNLPTDCWQAVKKRKFSESPPNQKSGRNKTNKTMHNYEKETQEGTTANGSREAGTSEMEIQVKRNRKITPPPIFVQGVTNYKGMLDRITKTIPQDSFQTKTIANDAVKISVLEVENYRKLVSVFRARNIKFFTYQLKSERAFKVVIRNLHSSINPDEIKEALQSVGFVVRNVTKNPLPLYFVDLEPTDVQLLSKL